MTLSQIIQQLLMLGALLFHSNIFLPMISTTPLPEDTLESIGPNRPLSKAPCTKTLNPGDKIQAAIDAVRDKTTPYVLCLNPGFYIGGKNGDTTFEPNHDFGDMVVGSDAGSDWWNKNDDGPYYGTIVLKNRKNFTLRGLVKDGQRATILGIPNDMVYPPETGAPQDQYPNDKALLLKIVNGDNIILENLTIDGFSYPDFPDLSRKIAVLNRLIWLQNTTNSRVIYNIIQHAGGECIRLKAGSTDNEIAYNTIASCGYYQFKVQPIARLRKNGEGIYVGTDPYQINANQINKSTYFGIDHAKQVDGTKNNLIHHNDIFPGSQQAITPPPQNPLLPGVKPTDGYGNECIDIKEDVDNIGRMVKVPGVAVPQLINNVVRDNLCQGQFDEDSGALDARSSNNLFEHNQIQGTVRGAALRLGGGDPKPIQVDPAPSDPVKGCFGTIVATKKWYSFNNRLRKNVIESYFNDFSDFNNRGGYAKSDCTEVVDCSDPANPVVVPQSCSEQKTLYVVKTFALADVKPENQATGSGICGNVADPQGALDWGTRLYKGKQQSVQFSRLPAAAQNLPMCEADANNYVDSTAPGIRGGCVGAICTGQ
jgi:parallel beta-helix repeat protein